MTATSHIKGPITHLYRIRGLKRAVSEIESQEIFFAHPEKLNDPVEGLRDIYWRGDAIVWKTLLKHYLVCLNIAWSSLGILGEGSPVEWRNIPIVQFQGPDCTVTMKAMNDEIFEAFFSVPEVAALVDALAKRQHPIRRAELTAYLRYLHMFALATIHRYYERHRPGSGTSIAPELQQNLQRILAEARKIIDGSDSLAAERPDDELALDAYFTAHNLMVAQLDLINQYNRRIDPDQKNRNFVFLGFADGYVDQLSSLVYPQWYAACFLEDCKNSSVWGNYGDNHTGICLKFKSTEKDGRPTIRLDRVCGLNNAGPTRGPMDHEFHKVEYGARLPETDFFRSLARLPIPTLKRHWYADEAGNRSPCGDTLFGSDDSWRAKHWATFIRGVTTKSIDWEYEQEWRLLLYGELDFTDDGDRKAKYEFDDLAGIIFGILTPFDTKLQIAKLIETKCRQAGRTDFKFYQAFYSRRTGAIEHGELSLLRFA